LAELLAGSPHHFAHQEVSGPFSEPLDPYTVVVLDAAAAAQGAVTRQAMLDYVIQGGALLFLGGWSEHGHDRSLGAWLSPLGIHVDTAIRVDGCYAALGEDAITQYWRDFTVERGCAIGTEADGGAAFLARAYGWGRLALLAGPTPLESKALAGEAEQRFASELFEWLARAGVEIRDSDGDGLPDNIEDANGNGVLDSGETDPLNPDTDGDGLPDGMEDTNRNGIPDDGETDPRNPDSNFDGVFDGADPSACPAYGTPIITGVTPQTRAEGGEQVLVTGNHFSPECGFWFGDRQAPWARIVNEGQAWVTTPDFGTDEGAEVPVRVLCGSTREGTLPGGYQYAPRTRVRVRLLPVGTPASGPAEASGELALNLDIPEGVTLGRVVVLVKAEPAAGFVWDAPRLGAAAEQSKHVVAEHLIPEGTVVALLDPTGPARSASGEWLRLSWRRTRPDGAPAAPVHVTIPACLIHTTRGARLAVDAGTVAIGE
jgi:hypothetical protein